MREGSKEGAKLINKRQRDVDHLRRKEKKSKRTLQRKRGLDGKQIRKRRMKPSARNY